MILKLLTKFLAPILVLTTTFLVSALMQESLNIDPLDQLGQTSAVALGQLILWSLMVIVLMFTVAANLRFNFSPITVISNSLVALVAISSGVLTGTSFVALGETPLYFGLWRGDLGVHMSYVQSALEHGIPSSNYPPLWPTIVAGINDIFQLNIFFSYKTISILSIGFFITINLLLFQLAFPKLLAEILALVTTFTFATDGFKSAGNIWTQLFLLILIRRLSDGRGKSRFGKIHDRYTFLILGIGFGMAVSLYYGQLWWISGSLAIGLLLTNFIKEDRVFVQVSILDFLLGSSIVLGPLFLGRLKGFDLILLSILISTALVIRFVFGQSKIISIVARINSFISAAIIFMMIFNYKVGDSYLYPSIFGNMVPEFNLLNIVFLIITFTLFILGTFILVIEGNVNRNYLVFLVGNILSASLMMFYFAFDMHRSNFVQLWPRASSTILDSWTYLIFILSFGIIAQTINYVQAKFKNVKNFESASFFASIGGIIVLSIFASQQLGITSWNLFPREGTASMYSYVEANEFLNYLEYYQLAPEDQINKFR
jgi:hypothetical protein